MVHIQLQWLVQLMTMNNNLSRMGMHESCLDFRIRNQDCSVVYWQDVSVIRDRAVYRWTCGILFWKFNYVISWVILHWKTDRSLTGKLCVGRNLYRSLAIFCRYELRLKNIRANFPRMCACTITMPVRNLLYHLRVKYIRHIDWMTVAACMCDRLIDTDFWAKYIRKYDCITMADERSAKYLRRNNKLRNQRWIRIMLSMMRVCNRTSKLFFSDSRIYIFEIPERRANLLCWASDNCYIAQNFIFVPSW